MKIEEILMNLERLVGCRINNQNAVNVVKDKCGVDIEGIYLASEESNIQGLDKKIDMIIDKDTAVEIFYLNDNGGNYYITEIGGVF